MSAHVGIRIPKFLVAGAFASFVNLAVLYVATEWFAVWYLLSSFIAYVVSFFTNFALQGTWVFKNHGSIHTKRKFTLFLLNAVFDVAASLVLLHLLVEVLQVYYMLSQALLIGVLAVKNFLLYQRVIFRPAERELRRERHI